MTTLRALLADPTVWEPRVSPDGRRVAWLSTVPGRPAVRVADADGGSVRTLAPDALAGNPTDAFRWTRDGDGVWLVRVPADDPARTQLWQVSVRGDCQASIEFGRHAWLVGATADGVVVSDWDRTVSDSGDLYHVRPDDEPARLTAYGDRPDHAVVAADTRLAYVVPDADARHAGDAVIQEPDGTLTRLDSDARPVAWADGRLLLAADGEVAVAGSDGDVTVLGSGEPLGFFDADRVLVRRENRLVVVPSDTRLDWEGPTAAAASGGTAAFVAASDGEPGERIVAWTGGKTTTLVEPRPPVTSADLAPPERVAYTDSAGESRDAWLVEPPRRPAPCVLHLYGFRPETDPFGRKFRRGLQHLHEAGYGVMVPAHGGERFDDRRGRDYAAAARWVAERDWSNGRTVALGHSSGGYDALVQVTRHPDAWTAAVAYNGIPEFRAFYNTMVKSRSAIRRQLGEASLDRLDELSPDPGCVGVPTLIVAGEQDRLRDHNRRFAASARAASAPVRFVELAGTGHWTRDLDVRVQFWRRVTRYLDRVCPIEENDG